MQPKQMDGLVMHTCKTMNIHYMQKKILQIRQEQKHILRKEIQLIDK